MMVSSKSDNEITESHVEGSATHDIVMMVDNLRVELLSRFTMMLDSISRLRAQVK